MKYCEQCNSTYPTEFTACPKDKAPLTPMTELVPGAILLDKYEILDKIGAGGMATVYKARHLTFNEIRALKIVSTKLSGDEEFLRRFKTEAIITRKLHHPNAVALDDFDTAADGRPFIVMEYVQGRSLRSWMHDLRTIPLHRALNITKQVAAALGAAHELGIVHRDIKPDNIIVLPQRDGSDLVKVFDFGIAKMRGSTGEGSVTTQTQSGMVVGTPQYVSPEQASGKIGNQIDGRSDLYSLGVVLYEMLTGKLPFHSDNSVGYLIHHMQTPPTHPAKLTPPVHLPDSVCALLGRALKKDRDLRFQTAAEMMAALDQPHTQMVTATPMAAHTGVARPGPGTRTAMAPETRAFHTPHSDARTVLGSAAKMTSGPAPVPAPVPAAVPEGTVYGEPGGGATVWHGKEKRPGPEVPWNKVGVGAAALLAVVLLFAGYSRYSAMKAREAAEAAAAAQPSDDQIKQNILATFASSDSLRDRKFDVIVLGGNVTLAGKVNDAYLSEIATALAHSVPGVKDVQNDIQVSGAAPAPQQVWRSGSNPNAYTPPRSGGSPWGNSQPKISNTITPGERDEYTGPAQESLPQMLRQQERKFVFNGYSRLKAGDYAGAEDAFRNALRINPNNPLAQDGLKRALAGQR